MTRNRFWVGASIVVVIAFGLASRKIPSSFPVFLGKYPGDAFWALGVYLGWAFIKPRTSTRLLAVFALATSYLVEFSQLYRAPWLDAIRGTTLGHIVLGSTFSWFDFAAYAVGVFVGSVLDTLLVRVFRNAGRSCN